ncbi:PO21 protein, partial [Mystacornis crossleyi]|nr:PO21 protein [Mystacornis crossleyi]
IATVRLTRACPINPRQRGFICASGCSENLKLLQLLVKNEKQEHRYRGFVFMDIAKAFDTVCHQHILAGLVQRRADPHMIHLVGEMHKNITMYII